MSMREVAEMANAGAAKELAGYADAFKHRDELKIAEVLAEKRRELKRLLKIQHEGLRSALRR